MATTKTKPRSPMQAPPAENGDMAIYVLHRSSPSTAPEEKVAYLSRSYVEFLNAERTVAVVGNYSSYDVVLKTDLALADVLDADSDEMTRQDQPDSNYYARLRANGVWFPALTDISSKTRAREAAAAMLAEIQDVEHPLNVALDGTFAPALTIALKKVDAEPDYRRDDKRVYALADIAQKAKVNQRLLALAIKEDRLVWATPPVAPKQVMVVVEEDATGVLTERLVDEIVLADRQVEGLGRIVHQGSITEHLLKARERHQRNAVTEIIRLRAEVEERLQGISDRAVNLLADLNKGQVIGRGFHDTLRLGDDVERAQQAATAYAAAVQSADLPQAFLESLIKGEFIEDSTYGWERKHSRKALEALSALNGMPLRDADGYY